MMNPLKVPQSLPSRGLQRQERVSEKIIANAIGAIHVGHRRPSGRVDNAPHWIQRKSRPVISCASLPPRVLGPCVNAELAWSRNRVKYPPQFAGTYVIRADVTGRRRFSLGGPKAHDDQILVDDARRCQRHIVLGVIAPQSLA